MTDDHLQLIANAIGFILGSGLVLWVVFLWRQKPDDFKGRIFKRVLRRM